MDEPGLMFQQGPPLRISLWNAPIAVFVIDPQAFVVVSTDSLVQPVKEQSVLMIALGTVLVIASNRWQE
jgi:hypothetical protein